MQNTRKNDTAFAALLRDLRIKAGLSMGQVARAVGVTTVYYSEIENAKKPAPPLEGKIDYFKLAEVLKADGNQIINTAGQSRQRVRFDLTGAPEGARSMAMNLARRLNDDSLTPQEIEQIRMILEKE
jgi:transcriptional regulator with XRE-family HTH domain